MFPFFIGNTDFYNFNTTVIDIDPSLNIVIGGIGENLNTGQGSFFSFFTDSASFTKRSFVIYIESAT